MKILGFAFIVAPVFASGCGDDDEAPPSRPEACQREPTVRTTPDGIAYVRTPDACYTGLTDFPFEVRYLEIDGLRQAYYEVGPLDADPILLLHGQPSWSYLYRKMIPVLVAAGHRVIAMDHLGTGRSDKPVDIEAYSFLNHNHRLLRFIEALNLNGINLFVQDWGSVIGLRIAGLHPDRFARIAVGNGALPVFEAGEQPFPPVQDPNTPTDVPAPYADIPAQQVPFFDGCERIDGRGDGTEYFGDWMHYAMTNPEFRPSETVEAMTWFDVPGDEAAAYDAPFPSRTYMAGVRAFPSLVNELPGQTQEAWVGLRRFEKPFLTLWAANDPGAQGSCDAQQVFVDNVPGAAQQAHDRLAEASHFLQDDQGEEIARRLVAFIDATPDPVEDGLAGIPGRGVRYCEVLPVYLDDASPRIEVWGTQGLSDCPADAWDAIDEALIREQTGASAAALNGPRYWVLDALSAELPDVEPRTFGDLDMQLLATVEAAPDIVSNGASQPYVPQTIVRTSTFTWGAGSEVYELVDPAGIVYIMQSFSQIVDPTLDQTDLPGLSARLALPTGWEYRTRILGEDINLTADGLAVVVQDDLQNSYQLATEEP